MRSYEQQFGDSPELAVLHLLGLFDRPAKRELIDVLRGPPQIDGLNQQLLGQSEPQWQRTLARLKHTKLLSEETPNELDAHPLVREHFGARLKAVRPEAWRAGHGRLYEYLRDSAKEHPDTLEQMAPLFQATHHGCQARRYQEVLHDVYYRRIQRDGHINYCFSKLGAISADLAAVSNFFSSPWKKVVEGLEGNYRDFLLAAAGLRLLALGRLREALAPLQAALQGAAEQEHWDNAAISARNLLDLHLALGEIATSIKMGEASVVLADQSGDAFHQMDKRAALANALHQEGNHSHAKQLFEEAEVRQAKRQPLYPRMYSLAGSSYCDLLLDLSRFDEVRQRAAYALNLAQQYVGQGLRLYDIAHDHVSLGRAALALGDLVEAKAHLDPAVDGLRKAGRIDYLPRGLLARAAFFLETGDRESARRDLDEAMRIAKRSEMRLFQCDAHLEYARLALAEGGKDRARGHVAAARRLVEETGYGRRRPEVEELETQLVG